MLFAITMLIAGLSTLVLAPRHGVRKPGLEPTPWVLPAPMVPPLLTPGPKPQLVKVPERLPMRVATANIYQRLSWSRALSDINRLMDPNTDLIGLNEINPGRAVALQSWIATRPGWHFYAPPASPTQFRLSNSLIWNDARLKLLDTGSEFGSQSATRKYAVDSRWITWAKFRVRKSGTTLYFLVTHMDPAVERRGVPRPNGTVRANQVYMDRLLDFAAGLVKSTGRAERSSNVIIVGDWNVNALADRRVAASVLPFAVLEGRGEGPIISNYSALGFTFPPTSPKSHRWIDYVAVWSRMPLGGPELSFQEQYSPRPVYSDHNPVIADLVLKYFKLKGIGPGPDQDSMPGPTPVASG